jgi:hypothetical protein
MFQANWTHHQEYTVDIIQDMLYNSDSEAVNWKHQHTQQNT